MRSVIILLIAAFTITVNGQATTTTNIVDAVNRFKFVMNNTQNFMQRFVQSRMDCVQQCAPPPGAPAGGPMVALAPVFACLPAKDQIQSELDQIKTMADMFKQSVDKACDQLVQPGVCSPPQDKVTSLKDVLGNGWPDHLFSQPECMSAFFHTMLPKNMSDCTAKCMVGDMKDMLNDNKFNAKLAWLSDPVHNDLPDSMKDMDLESAAVGIINSCDRFTLMSVIMSSGLFRFIQMKDVLMKMSQDAPDHLVSTCQCIQGAIPSGVLAGISSIDCTAVPADLQNEATCAGNMLKMVQDMKTAFDALPAPAAAAPAAAKP